MKEQGRVERDGWIVLVHLLPKTKRALSRSKLIASVSSCIAGSTSGTAPSTERAEHAISHCEANKWATSSPPRITERGRQALRRGLGLRSLPEVSSLREARERILLPAALGRTAPGHLSSDEIAAQVLTEKHGLPRAPSLRAAVDRLAWRQLGVETELRFDPAKVQRHLLRNLVPADVRVPTPTWRRLLAMKAAGAGRSERRELARAVVAGWVHGQPSTQAHGMTKLLPAARVSENQNAEGHSRAKRSARQLAPFASAVLTAAREKGVSKHYDDRAFIGSVWEQMRGRSPVHDMTLAQFKEQLILAHRAGHLRIACADLVTIMDPRELARSEAEYLGAKFHFVKLEAGGAR